MESAKNYSSSMVRFLAGASLAFFASGMVVAANESSSPHADAIESILQQKTINGKVLDATGEPIIGANVLVKGTTNGTITDIDGNFTLNVPTECVLQISYIGFNTQEIKVTSTTNDITVNLKEDSKTLEEVVVVGYGTQKKVNLSGSLSTINVSELTESRPITNVSHALAGLAAGVNVQMSSNQPGNDNASIKVRGQGTLNDSSPLVIIDGAEAGINTVNPQDIESMTVLKDAASSAIYGSRAANGVILITTKQGKSGKVKLDYNGYVSFTSPSIPGSMDPVSNYADYMEYINEGYRNSKMNEKFSSGVIQEWRDNEGKDPLRYPNSNFMDDTFKNSVSHNHVISMSGGSEKVKFYSSFGYENNPGVMDNTGFEKYSGRLNVTADVRSWLTLGAYINGYVSNMDPAAKYTSSGTAVDDVFTYASATTPGMVFRAPDGRYGAMNNPEDDAQSAVNNPLVRLNRVAGNIAKHNLRTRFVGTIKPFEGFSITGSYSYEFVDEERKRKPVILEQWNFRDDVITRTTEGKSSIMNYDGKTQRYFNDVVARYENRFVNDQLGLNAMIGASQEKYYSHNFQASKYDLIDYSLWVINGATGDASASGSSSEWAMRSFFGRVNLDWNNKYLLELNLRADQSSRFLSNKRTGYFPSGSFAWRIDQEEFMKDAMDKGLSNLKLRVSYGSLGNNSVGNYDALATYAIKDSNYALNNLLVQGLIQTRLANPNLTWESTYMTNVGLDFGFFNNRFTGTVDYFHKRTKDILINLPAPLVHGSADIPKQNSAIVTNQGVEFTLGWQDKVGDFSYGINGNFTYVKNIVNKFKGKDKGGMSISGANVIWEGHSINSQYLLRVDRIIQTDEDLALVQQIIDNAKQIYGNDITDNEIFSSGKPEKGDFLYKDTNGDGLINLDDREIVSDGPNPKFQFGLNMNASYKGFDFSILFQGQAGAKTYWQHDLANTASVRYGYQMNKEVVEGRWYEGRTDATYPRLLEYSNTKNKQMSDFYLQDLSFLKIRNIQLGYTLPKSIVEKTSLERIRVYGSMENFFTFTSFRGFDPELGGTLGYPAMKNVVVGINVSF
ncbi:Outer membrane cobalamin receptor protein [uncultured Bacteroides sp.]|uniref:SusC/RagA family TonB-linked outer membrane protein n=1 Tax=Bacteroides cellulolyticus TaxID=2981780 RepID=UPI0008231E1C|nr:TonB-dependent receptor [Bacteroides cellulolyticus]MCU6772746.1 TonB-dependent receptor [Bacteroides cellulolyticus]SCI56180.1 Outer membrane cobalamin receptor protein [uncultured Bacteroides sp.]